MPLAKHRSPFARRLLLSELESADLTHRARALVADAVADYEQFLWRQHGAVTPTQWTLERDKDDVRLYHGRRGGSSSQELLAVGAVHGELDDALFGVLGVTTEALRLRAAYTKDRLSNGAVLATIQRPTRSEPFRALTVKWLVSGEPLHVRALAVGKKSDVVALEATGMSALSNGETVGFLVLHSVDLPQAPPLQAYERASVSVCALWRQASDDRVQLYARGVVGGAADKARGLARATRATGGALLCLSRAVHCAQMKKLAWLLRCKASQLGGRRGLHDLHHRTSSSSSSERACEVCPSQMALSGRRSAKGACVVCARLVCSDCRVKRELCSIALDDRLLEQRVSFCVPCHTIAARAAAADVASDEAAAYSAGDDTLASQATASLVHVPGLAHDDGDGDGDHHASDAGSPRMDAPRRVRGFGDDDDDEDVDHDDDDDGGSDDHIDDVDRVFKPRKSLQTSSMAGTLEADDDELEGARRARPASGLAPAFMLGR